MASTQPIIFMELLALIIQIKSEKHHFNGFMLYCLLFMELLLKHVIGEKSCLLAFANISKLIYL